MKGNSRSNGLFFWLQPPVFGGSWLLTSWLCLLSTSCRPLFRQAA